MKKSLLCSFFVAISISAGAQTIFSSGFDDSEAAMAAAGWSRVNQSTPNNAAVTWVKANYTNPTAATPFGGTNPIGQAGGVNSFALVNFNSTTGAGNISNWLFTPAITVENGDVVSFYTRIGKNTTMASPNASFADNLQLRMSTNGATAAAPTTGFADVGDYTILLAEVNPNLNLTSYPTSWGLISATISGLSEPTAVKFAFRYVVPNGGPLGANSDIIGIDTFSVNHNLKTTDFFAQNFAMFPNPATDVLNLSSKSGVAMNSVQVTDLNGRIVKRSEKEGLTDLQVNVSDLNSGVYFISVETESGKGTTRFIKS